MPGGRPQKESRSSAGAPSAPSTAPRLPGKLHVALTAPAERLQATTDLAKAERDIKTARQELIHQLGLKNFEVVSATGAMAMTALPEEPASMDTLAESHPSVAFQKATVSLAEAGLK